MGEKRKKKDRLCTVLMLIFFSILAILIILPIYTIFLASFKPGGDLLQYGLNLGIDWKRMSLDNYVLLFTGQHNYWRWFFNSIFLHPQSFSSDSIFLDFQNHLWKPDELTERRSMVSFLD